MNFKDMVTVIQNDYAVEQEAPKLNLTADGHVICKASVPGYSLKLKKWSKIPTTSFKTSTNNFSVFLRRFRQGN